MLGVLNLFRLMTNAATTDYLKSSISSSHLNSQLLQEYLKFYTDYVHRNRSFPEVPQKQKLSAHFPLPFKHNVKYHFLHVQKLRQKTTEHCKVTQFTATS